MILKNIEILHLIIRFGLTTNFILTKEVILWRTQINMQTSNSSFKQLDYKFYQMPGRAIIVVCSLMDKLAQENRTQWLVTEQTKV